MKMKKFWILIAALVAFSGCAPIVAQQTNPSLLSPENQIHKLTILPPSTLIDRIQVTGDSRWYDMADDVNPILAEILSETLPEYGFEMVDSGISPEFLDRTPEAKYDLGELMAQFRSLPVETVTDPKSSAGYQISDPRIANRELLLGEEVYPFAKKAGADGVVFVGSQGIIFSGGMKTLGLFASVFGGSRFWFQNSLVYGVAIADGRDGAVLMALVGRVPLDDFTLANSEPGTSLYYQNLERLRGRLEDDIRIQLDRALTPIE